MRRQIVPPNEVHSWSDDALQKLVGKFVTVEVVATPEERSMYGGEWVGGTGVVVSVAHKDYQKPMGPVTVIMWDYGMGWQWRANSEVYIAICDGAEGPHNIQHEPEDPDGVGCLDDMGIRDMRLEEARRHVKGLLDPKQRMAYEAWLLENGIS